MPRGDTKPPRAHFSEDEDAAALPPAEPQRLRFPCAAHQCPMVGAIFVGGPDAPGQCMFHAREPANDWPKITQALKDWECVTTAILRARRVLASQDASSDGALHQRTLKAEWEAMLPAVLGSGWKTRVEPRLLETLGEWTRRLEGFLHARVRERQKGEGVIDETAPTPFAAEVREKLRGGKGNAADAWGSE